MSLTEYILKARPLPAKKWTITLPGSAPSRASKHSIRLDSRGITAGWQWSGHVLELQIGTSTIGMLDDGSLRRLDVRGTFGTEGKWWQGFIILKLRHEGGVIRLTGRLW